MRRIEPLKNLGELLHPERDAIHFLPTGCLFQEVSDRTDFFKPV